MPDNDSRSEYPASGRAQYRSGYKRNDYSGFHKNAASAWKNDNFLQPQHDEVDKLCNGIAVIHRSLIDTDTVENLKTKNKSDNLEEIFIRLVGEKQ